MRKIFLVSLIIFSSLFLTGCSLKKSKNASKEMPEASPTVEPAKPIEQTITTRPFVSLTATTDNHWLTIEMKNIPKSVLSLEYELLYFADVEGNKVERGVSTAGKAVDLNGQSVFSKKILLGSASCTTGTCKYKYDEGVTEGALSLILNSPGGKEKYETAYRIQKGKEGSGGLTTGDGVFSFVSSGLSPTASYLTISSIGVPAQLPTGVVPKTIPYAIFSSGAIKGGTVAFKTTLTTTVSIYAYDGKSWSKLTTQTGSGEAKATSSGQSIFILAE